MGLSEGGGGGSVLYHVRSSGRGSRCGGLEGARGYEVRVRGWSCSCAAYAFAAFGHRCGPGGGEGMVLDAAWGGSMLGGDVPLCKHLLACVLAERWDGAGGLVEGREVGREEMAGWAAGWAAGWGG